MPVSKKFKKRITEIIKDSDFKMTGLAQEMKISHSTLSQSRNYGIVPTPIVLKKIADYFGLPMDFVLGITDEENFEPSERKEDFVMRLNFLLESNNLTFYSLAVDHIFIAKNSLSTWKKKQWLPSIENLISIADYFKCSLDFLVGRTDIQEQYKKADDFEIE